MRLVKLCIVASLIPRILHWLSGNEASLCLLASFPGPAQLSVSTASNGKRVGNKIVLIIFCLLFPVFHYLLCYFCCCLLLYCCLLCCCCCVVVVVCCRNTTCCRIQSKNRGSLVSSLRKMSKLCLLRTQQTWPRALVWDGQKKWARWRKVRRENENENIDHDHSSWPTSQWVGKCDSHCSLIPRPPTQPGYEATHNGTKGKYGCMA